MSGLSVPRFSLACLLVILACAPTSATAADVPKPQRVPWTTSRIHGSPEPAKPYIAKQIYEKLTFREVTEIVFDATSNHWLILERAGKIFSIPHDCEPAEATLIADLKASHPDIDYLYGFAFHPKFAENRQVFITYTLGPNKDDGTKLSRFTLLRTENREPRTENLSNEQIILTWRSGGHNGANLQFGPDGFLYISTGDAEVPSPPDPLNTGQDITDLLSSILRIDVDHQAPGLAYSIPKDNPFIAGSPFLKGSADTPVRNQTDPGGGAVTSIAADKSVRAPVNARPEIWAFGLRNPWKMSFDRATGRLWCGDVGWELWEMIHLIERGGNYGWSAMEASQPVKPENANPVSPIRPPVIAHSHDEAASITGGYVYHGHKFHELEGAYLYGDWETGKIWALWHDGKQVTRHEEIADTPHKIIAFGQDADGELIYANYGPQGTLHTLERNPEAGKPNTFPRKLSETGLFGDNPQSWAGEMPGVYLFQPNAPMWQGETHNQYFIALAGDSCIHGQIGTEKTKEGKQVKNCKLVWPKDAVLVKSISSRLKSGYAPVETQLLHYDGEGWQAYTYRWRDDASDAELVPSQGDERVLVDAGGKKLTWRFHARAECMRCHNSWMGGALAFRPEQLEAWNTWGGSDDGKREMHRFAALGLVDAAVESFEPPTRLATLLANPVMAAVPRTYFHANCSHCHRQNAGGAVTMMLNAELPLDQMMAVGVIPSQGGLGLVNPKLIDPGNPWNSVICVRLAKTGSGHMPLIGQSHTDVEGLEMIEDWIARMNPDLDRAWVSEPAGGFTEFWLREKLASVEGAMQVLHLVDRDRLDGPLRQTALDIAWKSPQQTVRDLFDRFKPDDQREITLGLNPDISKLLAMTGDAKRGSAVLSLQGKLGVCYACHLVNGTGRDFGPDLSKVGSRLKREQILESLLQPSKVIAQGYAPVSVELRDGTLQAGFVVKEGAHDITLKTPTGPSVVLMKADIKSQTKLPASLMPEGQLQSLTAQEAADVLTYLESLK